MRKAGLRVPLLLGCSFLARTALCFVAPTGGALLRPWAPHSHPACGGLAIAAASYRDLASAGGVLSLRAARGGGGKMVHGVKKENLPQKMCVTCNRPFTWRKKWEKCWDEVTTCSKSCNAQRRKAKQQANVGSGSSSGDSDAPEGEGRGRGDPTSGKMGEVGDAEAELKAAKKEAKKAVKAERRAKRQGKGDPSTGQKSCSMCEKQVDLLIRCQVDASKEWMMVCGPCWPSVSGGVVDGDSSHPHYRYGGLWKNRAKQQGGRQGEGSGEEEEGGALAALLEGTLVS